jgi:hypothetical protein
MMCHSERSEESRSDPLFRDRPRGRARFLASLGMTPFKRVFQHPVTTELMGIPLRRARSYLLDAARGKGELLFGFSHPGACLRDATEGVNRKGCAGISIFQF